MFNPCPVAAAHVSVEQRGEGLFPPDPAAGESAGLPAAASRSESSWGIYSAEQRPHHRSGAGGPAAAFPTWLVLRSGWAGGGAGDGHQHLGSMGRPWPSCCTPASPVALPAGLVPHLGHSTLFAASDLPRSHDLWDNQICNRLGTACSLGRAHKSDVPFRFLGTFGQFPIPGNVVPKLPRNEDTG